MYIHTAYVDSHRYRYKCSPVAQAPLMTQMTQMTMTLFLHHMNDGTSRVLLLSHITLPRLRELRFTCLCDAQIPHVQYLSNASSHFGGLLQSWSVCQPPWNEQGLTYILLGTLVDT